MSKYWNLQILRLGYRQERMYTEDQAIETWFGIALNNYPYVDCKIPFVLIIETICREL